MNRRAAFLDRDGTLIADAHYLADPRGVRVLAHAAEGIQRLRTAGLAVVIVTNQSGIAQGFISEAQYAATERAVEDAFRALGAPIDATYHCPHHPSVHGSCECRKPGTGMYRAAAQDLGLALDGSLYVGDRKRDVEPALALKGTGVLVPSPGTPQEDLDWAGRHAVVAPNLLAAADYFLAIAHE